MAIPESFLNELVDRNDIVEVVSSYVRLSKKSGSNLFGLCPFHSEKTPSFSVSPDKQIYHCFGCGKGGGVINFIMEIENLSFPEAVEFLARRVNMQVPEEANDRESQKRGRMLALNREAARFFYAQLSAPGGEEARRYMAARRIGAATAKSFGLGYAPDSWDGLRDAMKAKGFSDLELFEAGLVRKGKSGGFYDTFRRRLMFPVIDVRGNVIGFSGRILGDGEPKYMNSPETLVFNKSRNLFALNLAKKSKSGYIILSEGNIDVVSLHQAGFDSAVASLGTSLTPEQARLLSRYTKEIIIAYDSDGAGVKAAQRAIGILEKLDMKVKVLRMSGAKDPDEFIQKRGAEAFRKLLEGSEDQIDYRLRTIASKYDLSINDQKIDFLREAYDMITRFSDQAKREIYAAQLSEMVGVKRETVVLEIEQARKNLQRKANTTLQKEATRIDKQRQPQGKELRYENVASASAEEEIIRLLYLDPELSKFASALSAEAFSSSALAHIYNVILKKNERHEEISVATLSTQLTKEEINLLVKVLDNKDGPKKAVNAEQSMLDCINYINDQKERDSDTDDLRALQRKMKEKKGYKG